MTKKEKRKARHARRVKNRLSRRALLKSAGATAVGLAASLVIPRMVHAGVPAKVETPTWERLLQHIGGTDPRLRAWVRDLAVRPNKPQRPLLLTGPDHASKDVFHDAMGLLLPEGGVVRYPRDFLYPAYPDQQTRELGISLNTMMTHLREHNEELLKAAWLLVINDHPALFEHLLKHARYRDGRFLTFSLVHDRIDAPVPDTIHFDVRPAKPSPILQFDLDHLNRECEIFRRKLARAA